MNNIWSELYFLERLHSFNTTIFQRQNIFISIGVKTEKFTFRKACFMEYLKYQVVEKSCILVGTCHAF